jgi:hypothetical protein
MDINKQITFKNPVMGIEQDGSHVDIVEFGNDIGDFVDDPDAVEPA